MIQDNDKTTPELATTTELVAAMTEIYAAQERLEIAVDELKQEQEFLRRSYMWLLVIVCFAFFAGKIICIAQLFDIYREER